MEIYSVNSVLHDNGNHHFADGIVYFSTKDKAVKFIKECGYTKEIEIKGGIGYFTEAYSGNLSMYTYMTINTRKVDPDDNNFNLLKSIIKMKADLCYTSEVLNHGSDNEVKENLDKLMKDADIVGMYNEIVKLDKEQELESVSGIFDNIDSIDDLGLESIE